MGRAGPSARRPSTPPTTTRATPPTRPEGTVYFFSSRPGGKGRFDLYACPFKDGAYGEAANLEPLNTEFQEWDPFVAPDESYLIFCSTKPGGAGRGRHLHRLQGEANGAWGSPVHSGRGGQLPGLGEPAVRHARREVFLLHLDPEREPGRLLGRRPRISTGIREVSPAAAREVDGGRGRA
ncbi:MAG: hypothetical protein MZU84_06400 [Sphingobacterium sp.]|nr:hypothetical protein [Sphingobacterium sp.]